MLSDTENNKQKSKKDDIKDEKRESEQSASLDTSAVVLMSISDNISKAAPIIALSGVGIPLAAGIYLVGKIVDLQAKKGQVMRMIDDCKYILGTCYSNYTAIIKTLEWYLEVIYEIKDKVKDDPDVEKVFDYMTRKRISFNTLKKIIRKMELITGLMIEVERDKTPGKGISGRASSIYKKVERFMNRNLFSRYYRQELTSEMSMFNSLFSTLKEQMNRKFISYNNKLRTLNAKGIITDKNMIEIDETIDGLYESFVNSNLDDLIEKTTTKLKNEGIMNDIEKYVDESSKAAEDHIKNKIESENKKGGKFTFKQNRNRKNRTKNTRRRKYIKE